jgi:tRNA pseudouridine13 synthase
MKTYAYDHRPIAFDFAQTPERFIVEELPLYPFSGQGAYLILKVRKREMSTSKLVHVLMKALEIRERDIGYAGLKDKSATTVQYLSVPFSAKRLLKNITTEKIDILESYRHRHPIKIGHLKGNAFSILLHDVSEASAQAFARVAQRMQREGIPNYFGYQRFGEDGKSYLQGKEIAQSGKRLRGAREKLLVASYQSALFNRWLASRVELSKVIASHPAPKAAKLLDYPPALVSVLQKQPQFFKLFIGESMAIYPSGKLHYLKDMDKEAKRFTQKAVTPTGLLCGDQVPRAQSDARHLEAPFDDDELGSLRGDRRFAWIWPDGVQTRHDASKRELRIDFSLPRGAYATTFLEEIARRPLAPSTRGENER